MFRELFVLTALPMLALGQVGSSLEAKMVTVKIDMPATNYGVDIHPDREQPLDLGSYQRRLKQYGVAVRSGQSIMVTKVKVKEKSVEFHLGGGGYGTFWDETGTVTASTASKSSQERRLEDQLRSEKDPNRRRSLESQLRFEREARERRNARARADAAIATEIKQDRIANKRIDGGSRFNIRFETPAAAEAVTAEMIRKMLSEYVSFDGH